MRRYAVVSLLTAIAILALESGTATAIIHQDVEDFSTTHYFDAANSTALWDTVAGCIGLPPFTVTEAGVDDTPDRAAGVAVADQFAYVADRSSGLQIIDVSDPAHPTRVGFLDTPGDALGLVVKGTYAYIADGPAGLRIINVSNPASPISVGAYDTPGVPYDLDVSGNYAYLADTGLLILNVSTPSAPTPVGSADTPGEPYDVVVAGDYAYVADGSAGLGIYNVANPAAPFRVGGIDTPGYAWGVAVAGNRAFVADADGGLQVFDITDPANPIPAGAYDTPGSAYEVVVFGDYALVADGPSGLQVLDISALPAITLAGGLDTPDVALSLAFAGTHAFVADKTSGLRVIDVFGDWVSPGANTIQSLPITEGGASVIQVLLWTAQRGSVEWEVSGDAGLTWQAVPADSTWQPMPGNLGSLVWRATFAYLGDAVRSSCSWLNLMWVTTDTIIVNPDGTGDFPTIQAAIDAAFDGDTVVLANGTYQGEGNRDLDYHGKAITVRSESDDPELCVIDCEGSIAEPHRGFGFYGLETDGSILRGVTVCNGYATDYGGGLLFRVASWDSLSQPSIINCVLTRNTAPAGAGFAVLDMCEPYFADCTITDNFGAGGGWYARSLFGGSSLVERCTFGRNNGAGAESHVCFQRGDLEFHDCTFVQNSSTGVVQGGVFGGMAVVNCEIVGNGGWGVTAAGFGMKGAIGPGGSRYQLMSSTSGCHIASNLLGGIFGYSEQDFVSGCTIVENGGPGVVLRNMAPYSYIEECDILANVGDGIDASIAGGHVTNNRVIGNGGWGISVGFALQTSVSGNVIIGNGGTGLTLSGGEPWETHIVEGNTVAGNHGDGIVGVSSLFATVDQNNVVSNLGVGLVCAAPGPPAIANTNLFTNTGGDWIGDIADQLGQRGNISADPLFCNQFAGDYTLHANSPCAPENHGGILIGALPVGCPATHQIHLAKTSTGPLSCGNPIAVDMGYIPAESTPDLRGYSIHLQAAGTVGFGPGDVTVYGLPDGAEWFHQIIEHGPGDCTVDYTLLGQPVAGISGEATLFMIQVHGLADGAGSVAVVAAEFRDIQNQPVDIVWNTSVSFEVDCTPPAAVTVPAAVGGHQKAVLAWTDPEAPDLQSLEIWRGVWHDAAGASVYPEYDDVPNVIPTRPASRAEAEVSPDWTLVGTADPGVRIFTDQIEPRGVYYYEIFPIDAAGNPGPPAVEGLRTFNYWLGDFGSAGGGPDGYVNVPDLTVLGAAYGTSHGEGGYNAEVDVGPTSDASARGTPLTDNEIGFEDMMIVGLNFGEAHPKVPPEANGPVRLAWSARDERCWSLLLLEPAPNLMGVRLTGRLPGNATAQLISGDLLAQQQGAVFLQDIGGAGLDISLGLMGARLSGAGELFRVMLSSAAELGDLQTEARSVTNERLGVLLDEGSAPDVPIAFRLYQNSPNPFNPVTTIAFALPVEQRVQIGVYTVTGRRVAVLIDEVLPPGKHEVIWSGLDDEGRAVASGSYFYRLEAGSFREAKRMTLVR